MKKYIIFLLALFFCLGVSSENSHPSKEELKASCREIQNKLNMLKSLKDSIICEQINKLKELKDTNFVSIELEKSNVKIFEGFQEILEMIPDVYARDTSDNIALIQFEYLVKSYSNYCTAIFKDGSRTISISNDFRKTIEDINKSIHKIKKELDPNENEDVETSIEDPTKTDNPEGINFIIWILLALIILLYVIVVVFAFFVKNEFKNSGKETSEALESSGNIINLRITNLQEKIDKLNIYNGFKGVLSNTASSHNMRQHELNNLKKELQEEINEVKTELKKITETSTHLQGEGCSKNSMSIGQGEESHSNKPQNNTITPNIKGLFAQLQSDGTFKTYDEDKETAFYIIMPDSSSKTTGTFSLKELTPESMKTAIDDRNNLLYKACDIEQTTTNPRRIKVEASGIAEKEGNKWCVKEKAKISLVD